MKTDTRKISKYELVTYTVEEPGTREIGRSKHFLLGQLDRKTVEGGPRSTNGAYLDGWYSPEKLTPPYVTEDQFRVFPELFR